MNHQYHQPNRVMYSGQAGYPYGQHQYQQSYSYSRPAYQQHMHPQNQQHAPQIQHNIISGRDLFPISEVVNVPDDLKDWVTGSKIQSVFLKVKEASGIGYITSNTDSKDGHISIVIHSATPENAKIARMLVEITIKEQLKYQMDFSRLQQMQENLFEVQGEIASGQRIEFEVPVHLVGLIIGKKGARVQEIQRETGVLDIKVNGESGMITVIGKDATSVQRVKEVMQVVEKQVPLTDDQVEWIFRDMSSLTDMKNISGCMVARLNQPEKCIHIIGTNSAVSSALLVLSTQFEYISKRAELYTSAKVIQEQLQTIEKRPPRQRYNRNDGEVREGGDARGYREGGASGSYDRQGRTGRDNRPLRDQEGVRSGGRPFSQRASTGAGTGTGMDRHETEGGKDTRNREAPRDNEKSNVATAVAKGKEREVQMIPDATANREERGTASQRSSRPSEVDSLQKLQSDSANVKNVVSSSNAKVAVGTSSNSKVAATATASTTKIASTGKTAEPSDQVKAKAVPTTKISDSRKAIDSLIKVGSAPTPTHTITAAASTVSVPSASSSGGKREGLGLAGTSNSKNSSESNQITDNSSARNVNQNNQSTVSAGEIGGRGKSNVTPVVNMKTATAIPPSTESGQKKGVASSSAAVNSTSASATTIADTVASAPSNSSRKGSARSKDKAADITTSPAASATVVSAPSNNNVDNKNASSNRRQVDVNSNTLKMANLQLTTSPAMSAPVSEAKESATQELATGGESAVKKKTDRRRKHKTAAEEESTPPAAPMPTSIPSNISDNDSNAKAAATNSSKPKTQNNTKEKAEKAIAGNNNTTTSTTSTTSTKNNRSEENMTAKSTITKGGEVMNPNVDVKVDYEVLEKRPKPVRNGPPAVPILSPSAKALATVNAGKAPDTSNSNLVVGAMVIQANLPSPPAAITLPVATSDIVPPPPGFE